jgi:hypothetical protein
MGEKGDMILKLIATHLLFPAGLAISTFFILPDDYLSVLIAQTALVILYFTGYWEFFRPVLKWGLFLSIEFLLLISIVYRILSMVPVSPGLLSLAALAFIEIFLLFHLVKILVVIFRKDDEVYEAAFPFKSGIYLITDGGNSGISRMMNYHFHSRIHRKKKTNRSMLYATDIIRLDPRNYRFMPPGNEDYPLFGQDLYCPMEGTVFSVVNDIEDNRPFSGNYPYNTGNTVVIKNDKYFLLLGHLNKGSIVVRVGEKVNKRDLIGKAGNSGMSERPHLHMQLMKSDDDNYWYGTGISMTYEGRNLFKNRKIILK